MEPILDRFNLNLFFALDAILNSGTLTEAARKSHLTQPAMSVSLKKLRGVFGDELVVYHGGDSRLTALALALRPRVRQVLHAAREVIDLSPEFDPATDDGTVRISAPDVVELTILGPLLARLANAASRMKVVSVPFAYQSVEEVFRQPLDIAVVAEPFASPDFAREELYSESMSCLVWREGRYGNTLSEEEYRGGRHAGISYPADQLTHPTAKSLQRMSEGLSIVARASTYVALPHLAVGTDLIVTTLTGYAEICATMLPLRVVPVPIDAPAIAFVAQWQKYRSDEPVIKWLLGELRAVVRARVAVAGPA